MGGRGGRPIDDGTNERELDMSSKRASSRVWRWAVSAAIVLGVAVAASPAGAKNPTTPGAGQGFVEDALSYGYLYAEAGYILTAGQPIEDWCGPLQGSAPLRVFVDGDGLATLKVRGAQDQALYLYEFAGPPPALIGMACGAIFDDDPTTVAPAPIGTGSGLMKTTIDGIEGPSDLGGFDVFNSVNGVVSGADGTTWKVRGAADLTIGEDGIPVGDPATFQGVTVQEIRRGG